jgi:hypothetical protein
MRSNLRLQLPMRQDHRAPVHPMLHCGHWNLRLPPRHPPPVHPIFHSLRFGHCILHRRFLLGRGRLAVHPMLHCLCPGYWILRCRLNITHILGIYAVIRFHADPIHSKILVHIVITKAVKDLRRGTRSKFTHTNQTSLGPTCAVSQNVLSWDKI